MRSEWGAQGGTRGRETQHTLLCTSECPGMLFPQPSANCPGCCRREGQRQLPTPCPAVSGCHGPLTDSANTEHLPSVPHPAVVQARGTNQRTNAQKSLTFRLTLSGLTPADSLVLQTWPPVLPAFLPHHLPTKPAARTRWDGRCHRTCTASPGVSSRTGPQSSWLVCERAGARSLFHLMS